MEKTRRLHWYVPTLELSCKHLVLIARLAQFGIKFSRLEYIVEILINDLGDNFDHTDILWEVPDCIDIDIHSIFFVLAPKFSD